LIKQLAVVVHAWTTRRLLWLFALAYAFALTSGFFWPISPKGNYVECPDFLLPGALTDIRDLAEARRHLRGAERRLIPPVPTLIVRGLSSRDIEMFFTRTAWKDVPGLKQIFLDGYEDDPAEFRHLCQALPALHIWHLNLNVGRLSSVFFLLLATLTLGGAVLQQTQAVFSLPHVRTVPGFAVPHLLIPLAIAAAGIVAASLIARAFGSDFWATVAVQVFAWGTWSAFEFHVLSLPRFAWRPRHASQVASDPPAATGRLGGWSGSVLLLAIAACLAILVARPYILESFLRGELPWLNVGFLVIGAALGGAAVVLMPTFCVWMNETGATTILSLQDVEKRRVEHGVLAGRFSRQLERLRRPSFMPQWLWRIHAMRSGNPDLLIPVLVRIVVPVVLVVGLQYFLVIVPAPNLVESFLFSPMFATAFVLLFLGAGWLIALSHTFSNWWLRRKTFSAELLYPWTRRQLAQSAFAAYAFDALGILAVLYTTLIFCAVALVWPLGVQAIWSGTLVIVLAAALLITGGLWLLTLRHRLLAGFLGVVGVLLLIVAMTSAVRFVQVGASLWHVALPFALVAWLFGLDAWRRWMKTEWGLFGPS
jgi:hypothetical protein